MRFRVFRVRAGSEAWEAWEAFVCNVWRGVMLRELGLFLLDMDRSHRVLFVGLRVVSPRQAWCWLPVVGARETVNSGRGSEVSAVHTTLVTTLQSS